METKASNIVVELAFVKPMYCTYINPNTERACTRILDHPKEQEEELCYVHYSSRQLRQYKEAVEKNERLIKERLKEADKRLKEHYKSLRHKMEEPLRRRKRLDALAERVRRSREKEAAKNRPTV